MTVWIAAVMSLCILFTALLHINKKNQPVPVALYKAQQESAFSFFEEDDSDIKIAGQEKDERADDDSLNSASELEKERECGNLEKAKALGALLSEKLICEDGESSFGVDASEDEVTRIQRRLLLAFTVISTVETDIKSTVLQGVVRNVLYAMLKADLPGFYEDINENGAFSFYTLCFRRGGDLAGSVGHTFSMLVEREGDPVIEELGKALYLRFVDITKSTIESFAFKQYSDLI